MFNDCIIKIVKDNVLISYVDDVSDHKINTLTLTLQDFVSSIKSSDLTFSTPILPANTFKYSINGDREIYSMYFPESKTDLKFHTNSNQVDTFENAYFPAFTLECSFNKSGYFNGAKIFMLKDVHCITDLSTHNKKYKMLMPNVYDGGNVCWGRTLDNINITRLNCSLLGNIFKQSIFNYDLFSGNQELIKDAIGVNGIKSWFEYLQKVECLPDNLYIEENNVD